MRYFKTLVALLAILAILPVHGAGALTATQVAQKVAAAVNASNGLKVAYTLTVNGKASKGTLLSQGTKFALTMPQISSWYNGTALYTLNPKTQETTVVTPTAQELLESNPMLYVKGGGSGYTCTFSPVKRNGKYVVDLVPKTERGTLRKLTVTVAADTFRPERIVVTAGNTTTTVDITQFTPGVSIPASAFEYPAAKYPRVEVVDLR